MPLFSAAMISKGLTRQAQAQRSAAAPLRCTLLGIFSRDLGNAGIRQALKHWLRPCSLRGYTTLPFDDGMGQWPVGVGKGAASPGYSGVHDVGGVESLLKGPLDVKEKD